MGKYQGFTSVELRKPTRASFDLSHEKRMSSRIGKLTPVFISETLPNDTFRGSTEVLVKLAPMVAPIYHRLNLYVHYFFIPIRILWDSADWETFITGGRVGEGITTPPQPPNQRIDDILAQNQDYLDVGSVADYLGVPPIPDADVALWADRSLDMLPHAAFYRCWYDYYRDRNYVPDNTILPLLSGNSFQTAEIYKTRYRCWEHDYFTSALLTTQRGAEVLMPLSGSGTVTYTPFSNVYQADGTAVAAGAIVGNPGLSDFRDTEAADLRIENIASVDIDTSSVSINDLRRANRLQEWMERNQLAGSRMNESILAHFNKRTSDSRLQRAEYLGGGKAVIQISEVMTTAYSEDSTAEVVPPGNPAGRGSTYADTNSFSYNCEEWGFVIGILSVLPTSAYMQGLPRMFQARNTFLEYPWPTFAHLGEQEVFDWEIFMSPISLTTARTDAPLFGYQSRYSDWKHIASSSHGDFRTTLDFWHITRKFADQPNLSEEFVTFEDELQDRIFNVSGVDTLWMYIYNKVNVKRSLPYFGTPQM